MELALAWILAQSSNDVPLGLDAKTLFIAYGAAAPFAALCLIITFLLWRKVGDLETANGTLRDQMLQREKDYLLQLAPIVRQGAQLYHDGNENAAAAAETIKQADDKKIVALTKSIEQLVAQLAEGKK